jgi:hypothetical protein
MDVKKPSIGGLKPTTVAPVPGVLSPGQGAVKSPMQTGSGAVVKTPKAKTMGQAGDKPSVFYGSLNKAENKVNSINKLQDFLIAQRSKKKKDK